MRRISTKIALPLILGLASIVAVACGTENPDPDDAGGSGGGSTDIGDGEGGEPNTGGSHTDGSGGANTDGSGGTGTGASSSDGEGGEGGESGTGGEPPIIIEEPPLPECDEPDGEIESGPLDGDACWGTGVTCKGNATEQFLQQCSGTCIEPFDNFARIDGFTGTLPPL